jgi:hypothetical protein
MHFHSGMYQYCYRGTYTLKDLKKNGILGIQC